ncbi:MAG: DUF5690 family protein [Chitinophagaceae bacterium]
MAATKKIQRIIHHPAWALVAAFGTYFCMYGFRKPYTAASFNKLVFFGLDYKFLLVIAQTAGYVIAKWIGIKVIAEIKREQRIRMLLLLIVSSELMLLLFGIVPQKWNFICLFLNGLFLGVVFGLVLGFLEGRQKTEALIAGLCASFIVSDGFSKSIGKMLLDHGVGEMWMPFFAGLIFLLPSLLFMAMLRLTPVPSNEDIVSRSVREPMSAKDRWNFFIKYAPGLTGILLVYLFVTLLRSVRADFAPELWRDLGYAQTPALYTQSELIVSFGVIIINGLAIFILNHYKAFRYSLYTCLLGFIILLITVMSYGYGLGKFAFMVLVGLGVYIPYVAVHTTIFERMIAVTREKANVGFLMYMADSVGYTGYIVLMLLKYIVPAENSILSLFIKGCICLGIAGGLIVLYCTWYFKIKIKTNERQLPSLSTGQSSYI